MGLDTRFVPFGVDGSVKGSNGAYTGFVTGHSFRREPWYWNTCCVDGAWRTEAVCRAPRLRLLVIWSHQV